MEMTIWNLYQILTGLMTEVVLLLVFYSYVLRLLTLLQGRERP